MAVDKRVVAGGGAAALLLALFAFSGDAKADEEEEKKPARPLTAKERAVALAVKFAHVFGVPSSLILGLMAVGGWRAKGHVANSRGGSWGYTFMSLATAVDLTKRFPQLAKSYWPRFNGTGQSLLDPETNIALGAYQMALQWRKFKRWSVASLSYYAGAGRMAGLVKATGGKLPATLPADVSKMRAAWLNARRDPIVARAIANDGASATGAPWATTSEDAMQKWNALNTATTNLDSEISAWFKRPGKRTTDENTFVNAWLRFRDAVYSEYKDNSRFKIIPDLAWSVWDRGNAKLAELQDWANRFQGISGKKSTVAPIPQPEKDSGKMDWGPVIKGGLVVGGLIGAASLVNAVRK